MKTKYVINDWADNDVFDGMIFTSFDKAHDFLTAFIEKEYPETTDNDDEFSGIYEEYWIKEAN